MTITVIFAYLLTMITAVLPGMWHGRVSEVARLSKDMSSRRPTSSLVYPATAVCYRVTIIVVFAYRLTRCR